MGLLFDSLSMVVHRRGYKPAGVKKAPARLAYLWLKDGRARLGGITQPWLDR